MRITDALTDDTVLAELGSRVARARLDRNLTQQELADEAGVGRSAVQKLERGKSIEMTVLIRILRALELLEGLNILVPESLPSPLEQLERQGQLRRRASRSRHADTGRKPSPPPWGTT